MLTRPPHATTCAFVITRFGATAKPLLSNIFWQVVATPRIFTTLWEASVTTRWLGNEASGESASTIGVRSNGWLTSVPRATDSALVWTTSLQSATAPAERR